MGAGHGVKPRYQNFLSDIWTESDEIRNVFNFLPEELIGAR